MVVKVVVVVEIKKAPGSGNERCEDKNEDRQDAACVR